MGTKRLRIFAGPNGSGKSTFINKVKIEPPAANFKLGFYVNADDIEKELAATRLLSFNSFGIKVSTRKIQTYFKRSTFAPTKLEIPDLYKYFTVNENVLSIDENLLLNSYIAADLAEFIRSELLHSGSSFSYETVMSDSNKVTFLKKAKKAGYKIYLYFFCTEDPLINVNRVDIRVAQKGHAVKKEVIEKRYYKSLENLLPAIKISDRAYLFDNSKKASVLIAEITGGKQVRLIDQNYVPTWFVKNVVDK